MDETLNFAVMVGLMGVVTYLPRALPLQLSTSRWPKAWLDIIDYLPVALIGAMVVPPLLTPVDSAQASIPAIGIAAVTFACAYWSRSLLLTVILGTGLYMAAPHFVHF